MWRRRATARPRCGRGRHHPSAALRRSGACRRASSPVGESDLEGAVREVLEETGFHVRVGRPLGETRYDKSTSAGSRPKVVRWWAMQAEEGAFSATREVDGLDWLSLAEAVRTPHPRHRSRRPRALRPRAGADPHRAAGSPRHRPARRRHGTATIASGRSTSAASPRPTSWCASCPASRSARSRRPTSVDASTRSQPLADALRLEVHPEPMLSEVGLSRARGGGGRLVRGLGGPELDAVACSQGDVIPDLLGRIAREDELSARAAGPLGQGLDLGAQPRRSTGRLVGAGLPRRPEPA